MYRLKEILDSFSTLVGWNQGRTKDCQISETATVSDSGLYFDEAHPMLTLRAVKSVMPKEWEGERPQYDELLPYRKGDIVSFDGKEYISLADNNVGHDLLDAKWWDEYNLLTDYVNSLSAIGIKQVVQRFIRDKVVGMESKSIVDRRCLFDGVGNINARIENKQRLVGFELSPIRVEGVTTKLERIGLQFAGNKGEVTFYLFHSSRLTPVWQQTFNYTKGNGSIQWFDLKDLYLPYVSAETNAGGSWYLVYDQNALPSYMDAINFGRDWAREPCGTCNKGDVQLYRLMSKYIQVSPFCVGGEGWDKQLWNIDEMIYTNTLNYGINLQFSIGCDITDIMIAERMQFAEAIQLQVASNALRTIALNPEVSVNRVQSNADRNNILYELDGNGMAVRGLHGDLEKAYKALSFNTKGLAPVCLTCHNKGVRFMSV